MDIIDIDAASLLFQYLTLLGVGRTGHIFWQDRIRRNKYRQPFDWSVFTDEAFYQRFRFMKEDIPRLRKQLRIPPVLNSRKYYVTGDDALLLVLARLSFPGQWHEMQRDPCFRGYSETWLSDVFHDTNELLNNTWRGTLDFPERT
jgi:hypothetical protein